MCLLQTRMPKLYGITLIGEVAWLNILYSAFHFQKLLFQFFLPISHLIGCSWSTIYRSHLTPCKSSSWHFGKSFVTTRKSLIGFRKLSRRSTMTRPWWDDAHINNFQKAKEAKPSLLAAANQRSLNAKASIADITAEVENDQWESVRKLTQDHDISI